MYILDLSLHLQKWRMFLLLQVYELVGLTELYYAGSHGMDIMLPIKNTSSANDSNCIKDTDQQVLH